MQITVTPRQQFQKTESAGRFRNIAQNTDLHTAITHALAEMNLSGLYGAEQMRAVGKFLDIFLNLAEKPEPARSLPSKTLDNLK